MTTMPPEGSLEPLSAVMAGHARVMVTPSGASRWIS